MFVQILKRIRRSPLMALCVVLTAAVLTAALCVLEPLARIQKQNYDEFCATVPVQLTVTNLSGTRADHLDAPGWVVKAFTSRLTENGLYPYVYDVQLKGRQQADSVTIGTEDKGQATLVGISGLKICHELSQGNGSLVTWYDGFDVSLLRTKEPYCLLPKSMLPEDYDGSKPLEVTFRFSHEDPYGASFSAGITLTVAGIHTAGTDNVYCPYELLTGICADLQVTATVDAICATLTDNSTIAQVREVSKSWFAEPNPIGEKTPWNYSYYFYYPYALRIDDSQLVTAERNLKVSILLNELCAYLLVGLSAAAGFFIGFLMIRSRKREISLMRTLGTPILSVYVNFALEQMLCVALGAALGGAAFTWQPMSRVGMFVGIYFVGLSAALMIFLRKNLMSTMKEAE